MATRKKAAKKTARKKVAAKKRRPVSGFTLAAKNKAYRAAKKRAVDAAKKASKAWREAVRKAKKQLK
jgi:hypothetical protein